jgi:hypothetical protein
MDLSDIIEYLKSVNSADSPTSVSVTDWRPNLIGASRQWRAVGEDGNPYLVKYSWNPQERWLSPDQVFPQRTVVKELLCGRLGQLFTPAVTPFTCVVDMYAAALTAIPETENSEEIPPTGPSVGISHIEGSSYTHEQWAELFQRAPDEATLARIVVYMLWLNALDPEILVAAKTGRLYSIDHGWYLAGQGWHTGQSRASLEQVAWSSLPLFYAPLLDYLSDEALRAAADQLQAFTVERIIAQFAHVPTEWGADIPFLAGLTPTSQMTRQGLKQTNVD